MPKYHTDLQVTTTSCNARNFAIYGFYHRHILPAFRIDWNIFSMCIHFDPVANIMNYNAISVWQGAITKNHSCHFHNFNFSPLSFVTLWQMHYSSQMLCGKHSVQRSLNNGLKCRTKDQQSIRLLICCVAVSLLMECWYRFGRLNF